MEGLTPLTLTEPAAPFFSSPPFLWGSPNPLGRWPFLPFRLTPDLPPDPLGARSLSRSPLYFTSDPHPGSPVRALDLPLPDATEPERDLEVRHQDNETQGPRWPLRWRGTVLGREPKPRVPWWRGGPPRHPIRDQVVKSVRWEVDASYPWLLQAFRYPGRVPAH